MSDFPADLPATLLRATLLLALSALVVRGFIWAIRPHSPRIHRLAWAAVLIQGLVVTPWSFDIPWYEPPPAPATVSAQELSNDEPLPDFTVLAYREEAAERQSSSPLPVGQMTNPSSVKPAVSPANSWSLSHVLAFCWLGGAIIFIAFIGGSYLLLLNSLRRARTAKDDWQREWQLILEENRVRSEIPLLVDDCLGPMLCRLPSGYCVVVPKQLWGEFSRPQRIAILRHELAHYQRSDIWKTLAARLLALPHWFNPLAWWAVRKFEETGEWACDQRIADSDPRQVPDFARALLEIVEPESRCVGASAVRGGSLAVRLRRLLAFQVPEDSVMKRSMLLGVLICLIAGGLFRFHLVAKEPSEAEASAREEDFGKRVTEFAAKIQAGDSELLNHFQKSLRTRAGVIVIQDRAAHFENMLREQAQTNALPGYIDEHFVKDGEKYRLRDGQQVFRSEVLRAAKTFTEDVDHMKPVVQEFARNMAIDSELERLVARFLKHDAAPAMIYVEELRKRLRPDEMLIQQRLGELFVANEQGQFVIRAARRPEAEEHLKQMQRGLKHLKHLRAELKAWSEDFAETDDLHKQLKQAMTEPRFATFVAAQLLGDVERESRINQRFDEFFEHLENLTQDTGDGLQISEEGRTEAQEIFGRYRRVRDFSKRLAKPVKSFAMKIKPGDELQNGWRELLQSDLIVVRLALEFGGGASDPADAIRNLLGEVLEQGDDGKYHVRAEEPEEVTEFIRRMFRGFRQIRRKGRVIDELAEKLDDVQMREALSTMGGKFVIAQSIQKSLVSHQHDGLAVWIDEHFQQTDEGLVLKDGAEEDIESILNDVREVQKELQKDDF